MRRARKSKDLSLFQIHVILQTDFVSVITWDSTMEVQAITSGCVLVTTASQAEAEVIAQTLVEEHLAACVSLFPIQSVYAWQGKVQQEQEWQLVIKTDLQKFERLEARVRSLHSYQVPEIIALPIVAGFAPYLGWINEQVSVSR